MITQEVIDSGMSYETYRELIDDLLRQGKTTGSDHAVVMLEYTKMNVHRMNRLDKTIELSHALMEELSSVKRPVTWMVLTEAWCGDAAQNIPILAKMATASSNIDLKLILRDENVEIMDQYLTNGGRAIPKLIMLDEHLSELGTWGPRPTEVQQMVLDNKRDAKLPYAEFAKVVQKWYAQDKGKSLQREIQKIIEEAKHVLDEQP